MKLSSSSVSVVQFDLDYEGCFELRDGDVCVGDLTYLRVPGNRAVLDSVWFADGVDPDEAGPTLLMQLLAWARLAGVKVEIGSNQVRELVARTPVARHILAA